ncbi:MAG: D-alanyl-D-alanine carboxypeptidase [Marinosulfonomonas sp.]|nr:MAG: D-alanyl-D-alanine carboxypeptidase [Marinosulfonomonas sp.]
MALLPPLQANSAPYAAMVIDARSGEVLHSRNADTRLHPASLTKMMTLYVTFEAIRKGEISLDTVVKISSKAANEPPSKLGLKAGQKIKIRYLIRAAAVKSANDAATALGEAVSGSEAAFARRMNRTAKALGMSRTTFKNAHGLTEKGHMSTARDMTTLGRRLFFDYPDYYNLFSRRTTTVERRKVSNTNIRFLNSYKGSDGIKTGYTRAAGFNLVASARRGNERIITTVFGGVSTASRNAKVAELMNLGFRRAPSSAPVSKPSLPVYADADMGSGNAGRPAGKTLRLVRAVSRSMRPVLRPDDKTPDLSEELLMAMALDIQNALASVQNEAAEETPIIVTAAKPGDNLQSPQARPNTLSLAAISNAVLPAELEAPEVVTRISTSGGRFWGINVGSFNSRYEAERILLKTALRELGTLDEALRKVVKSSRGYEANFVGLSKDMAALACRRLSARDQHCTALGPT